MRLGERRIAPADAVGNDARPSDASRRDRVAALPVFLEDQRGVEIFIHIEPEGGAYYRGVRFAEVLAVEQIVVITIVATIENGQFRRQLVGYQCALHAGGCVDTTIVTDRKSTRLNSSHVKISYAVFCLK